MTWYDNNEWAYSVRVTDLAKYIAEQGLVVLTSNLGFSRSLRLSEVNQRHSSITSHELT
ncbi:MAG: hypothetical protein R3A10_21530 [Caldilineaceae bacterium]